MIAHDARRDHPMAAIYRTRCRRRSSLDLVAGGERRMPAVTEALETRCVPVSDPEWLTNVNALRTCTTSASPDQHARSVRSVPEPGQIATLARVVRGVAPGAPPGARVSKIVG